MASIYANLWNKRKRLHKKRVQLPEDWFGTPTWPPFHCFGTPIWPPWRHVKTLHMLKQLFFSIAVNSGFSYEYLPRFHDQRIIVNYYSFKIFPRFWLAKRTRTIHHNQLLMTKFGKILCLTRKWRQKCSPLQVEAPLPRRPGNEVELFWLWKKMADISLLSRVRTTAGTRRNNSWKRGKNSKKTTRRATSAIWRIFGDLALGLGG